MAAVLMGAAWAAGLHPAQARDAGPDLLVELRQVAAARDDQAVRYSAGAESGESVESGESGGNGWKPVSLRVRSGDKGSLQLQDAVPMQWLQTAATNIYAGPNTLAGPNALAGSNTQAGANALAGTPAAAAGASAAGSSGAVAGLGMGLVWFDAGQSVTVRPRWDGKAAVVLELEWQRLGVGERPGADLPRQSRAVLHTSVTLPLGVWVTVAVEGRPSPAGSYRSDAGERGGRLLQVRVQRP